MNVSYFFIWCYTIPIPYVLDIIGLFVNQLVTFEYNYKYWKNMIDRITSV